MIHEVNNLRDIDLRASGAAKLSREMPKESVRNKI